MKQRTYVMLKPDAYKRKIMGEVLTRFENKDLDVIDMKMMRLTEDIVNEHYNHLLDKPFYHEILEFMTSGPVVGMIIEGDEAVSVVRKLVGATNPTEANPGTIRGDLSNTVGENIVHASDSVETADEEINRFFGV